VCFRAGEFRDSTVHRRTRLRGDGPGMGQVGRTRKPRPRRRRVLKAPRPAGARGGSPFRPRGWRPAAGLSLLQRWGQRARRGGEVSAQYKSKRQYRPSKAFRARDTARGGSNGGRRAHGGTSRCSADGATTTVGAAPHGNPQGDNTHEQGRITAKEARYTRVPRPELIRPAAAALPGARSLTRGGVQLDAGSRTASGVTSTHLASR